MMILWSYIAKAKTSICFYDLLSFVQGFYNMILIEPLVDFDSIMSSSIRCESYLSWFWILSVVRLACTWGYFIWFWSCLSSVFSMDLAYKCLRISCRLWLISWSVSLLLQVFILTCLNKAWVSFLDSLSSILTFTVNTPVSVVNLAV